MITFQSVVKRYGDKTVYDGLNLTIADGEITCVLGGSGEGKTTLLNMIARTVQPDGGKVTDLPEHVAYMFQESRLIPHMTVMQNLLYACPDALRQRIDEMLALVQLERERNAFPSQLSGGMRQRVSMARAFLSDAPVLLMDEPYKNLDIALKTALTEAFVRLWKADRRTTVFVTHDVAEALLVSDRVLIVRGGQIVYDACVPSPRPQSLFEIDQTMKHDILSVLLAQPSL